MRVTGDFGDRLGPKLSRLISQTIIATKRGLLPTEHKLRTAATQEIIDTAGREVAEHYRPLVQLLLDADDGSMNPAVRSFLEDAMSGEHQLKAIGGLLMGPATSSLSLVLSNYLAPAVYKLVGADPALDLDPQVAATAAAQRIIPYADGAGAAHDQGYGAGEFQTLYGLALAYPGIPDALDMLRRGIIDANSFTTILERNAVPDNLMQAWRDLRNILLSPSDAALAQLRGNLTREQASAISRAWGVSQADHDILVANTGEPPGPEQLAEALRRGFIDEATFTKGILESRVRDEWIPTMLKLRFTPMSVADAVNAVVQDYLTEAQASAIAEQNGLEPGQVDILLKSAGEPLSRTELETLYNRGIVTEDQVVQGLRESRLKNKYNDYAFDLHVRLLEPRELSSSVESGAITQAEAVKRAMEYGFSAEDARILVNGGVNRKLKTYRERVVSSAEGMYEINAITSAQFLDVAKSMGFDDTEAQFILKSAELRRQEKTLTQVTSAIRAKYVAHHIDGSQASALLDAAGIPAAQRDFLLNQWTIERAANVKVLTPTQIVKAHKLALISDQDALDRLVAQGYTDGDAALLIEGA
jgi:hypothetical protein